MYTVPPAIALFGTPEPSPAASHVTAGPLSVQIIDGAIRELRWHGVEVICAIDCPIRDEKWATSAFRISSQKIKSNSLGFEFECCRTFSDDKLQCRLLLSGSAAGLFRASMELTANHDYYTNRAGFTVLHPQGLAGSPLKVIHSDDSADWTHFPRMISPTQIASDIAGLSYEVEGARTNITFIGEIFEMEDQRNWGDASYKTYCRPLALPIPYLLQPGSTVVQTVEVRMSGRPSAKSVSLNRVERTDLNLQPMQEALPTIGLALESPIALTQHESRLVRACAPKLLQLRIHDERVGDAFEQLRTITHDEDVEIELEIVVPANTPLDAWLAGVADNCKRDAIKVSRVVAMPELYLKSYQPNGPWPEGPTPRDACIAARRAFPQARIGSGVLTNFVELNRCRPDLSTCDYISHAFTALVHAADDRSVVECLKAMSHVFASARSLGSERDYRLGLVSIGMRSNPYGSGVAPNPLQIRVPMARVDPRQRGLFGAAWAVGAVAATAGHRISSLAIAAPVGPFGIVYRRAEWPQPVYDDLAGPAVYPMFHVFKALSQTGGSRRISVSTSTSDIKAVAAEIHGRRSLVVANLSANRHVLTLPCCGRARKLDQQSFVPAALDPDWLVSSKPDDCEELALEAFNVAFIDLARGSD